MPNPYDRTLARKAAGGDPGTMQVFRRPDGTFFWFIDYGVSGWRAGDVALPDARRMIRHHGTRWQRLKAALCFRRSCPW